MLRRFLPRNGEFFAYFRQAALNLVETAQAAADLLGNLEDVERQVRRLRDLEHRGDEITHRIYGALDHTFVTPLDREDIRSLASELDDFVDDIEEAAKRVGLYHINSCPIFARQLAQILVEQATALAAAVALLERIQDRDGIVKHIVEVNRLEDEADDVLHQALGSLYDGVTEIPALIEALHWGELYQLLENATDRGEDAANTIETIVMKYA